MKISRILAVAGLAAAGTAVAHGPAFNLLFHFDGGVGVQPFRSAAGVPVLHIADCVGDAMEAAQATNAALIGTGNVMTESFYRRRLVAHGIDLLPPDMDNVEALDRIIYDELMIGKVTRDAERALKTMITVKEQEGAEAVVLACTELELVVDVDANVLPIYDSTRIHAEKAAEWILGAG